MGQPTWGLRRFEYQSFLGRGGMGAVYEVFDRELGAHVALKSVGRLEGQDLFRFKREFRAIRELYHPNIVHLGELFELDGEWGYTMELVHGVDLVRYVLGAAARDLAGAQRKSAQDRREASSSSIRTVTRLGAPAEGVSPATAERRLRRTLAQLAEALRFLHAHGRVHRDVKPSNVLVSDDERTVLLDFGLVGERLDERFPPESAIVGTAAYMAPEQAAAAQAGPEADWYAVGVILYEVLTGRVPFDGSPHEVLCAKQREDPLPPSRYLPELPADLVSLCTALLARDPAGRPRASEVLARLSAAERAVSAPIRARPPRVVCIGRDGELETLSRAFEQARDPRGRCLLVHGPSGIGKTTLLASFLEQLAERQRRAQQPLLVLRSHCREYEEVSFKAFDELFDALSTLLQRSGKIALAGLRSEHAAALCRAFPVLRRLPAIVQLAPAGGPEGDPKQLRMALYAAVRELFRAVSRSFRVVIAIEDVHWADADSWALVSELIAEHDPAPLLLVMSARCELVYGEQRLDDVRDVLSRTQLQHLPIAPLGLAAAEELVERELASAGSERADAGCDKAVVRGILAEAAGHPLLLTIMARHVAERGATRPLSLSEVVSEELAGLCPIARELMVATCLMGAPAERRVLAEALQIDQRLLTERADALVAKKLLRSAGANGAALEAHHEQVRTAVLAHVRGADRIAWHRRLAQALDDESEAREAAVQHYREAGDLGAASRAAERAAERAFRGLAFDRAARLMEQSLCWSECPAERTRLTERLAEALSNAGRSAEAAEKYLLASESASGHAALELRREAALHWLAAGEHPRGKALLAQALAELALSVPTSSWGALVRRAWLRARLRGSRYRVEDQGRPDPEARARLELCASTAVVLGTVDPIVGSWFSSLYQLLALRSRQREHVARALLIEAVYAALLGDRARGARLLGEAKKVAGSAPSPLMAAQLAANRSAMQWAEADFRAALWSARTAHQQLATRCQRVSWELVTLELVETNALFFLGRYRELSRRVASCLRAAEERGDRYGVTNMLVSQASTRFLAQDRPDDAHASIERGAEAWRTASFDMQKLMLLQSRAYLCLYRGDAERALGLLEASRSALRRSLLLALPAYRVLIWYVECQVRLTLAERAEPVEERAQLARALALSRKLARAPGQLGPAFAKVIFASCESRARGRLELGSFTEALAGLERAGLQGYAAALRLRAARALEPDSREASLLRDRGLRFMAQQEVRRPEQFAHVLVPSFEPCARAWLAAPLREDVRSYASCWPEAGSSAPA